MCTDNDASFFNINEWMITAGTWQAFSELKEDDNLVLKEKLHLRKVGLFDWKIIQLAIIVSIFVLVWSYLTEIP